MSRVLRESHSKAHSQHCCGARTDVWGTLASLVTDDLQMQDSDTITGPWKEVDLPSLVFIMSVVCEL